MRKVMAARPTRVSIRSATQGPAVGICRPQAIEEHAAHRVADQQNGVVRPADLGHRSKRRTKVGETCSCRPSSNSSATANSLRL